MLRENRHKLMTLLEKINTQTVLFEEEKFFINLNYPKDYKIAIELSNQLILK